MDNSFRHSKPFRSQPTTRPFATAIRALAAGCVLVGIAALLHDRSPMARLLAERGASVDRNGRMNPANASPRNNAWAIAGDTLSATASSAARGTVSDAAPESSDLGERPRRNAQHFWNASQSTAKGGPAIRLGTPLADENSFDRGKSRSSIGDEPGDRSPLVTRTYRPNSMSAASLERLVRPLLTARGQTLARDRKTVGCEQRFVRAIGRRGKAEHRMRAGDRPIRFNVGADVDFHGKIRVSKSEIRERNPNS